MSSHFLTDKSLSLEAQFSGTAVRPLRGFAEPGLSPRFGPDRGFVLKHVDLKLELCLEQRTINGKAALHIEALPTGLGDVTLDLGEVELHEVRHDEGLPIRWIRADQKVHLYDLPAHGGIIHFRYSGQPSRGVYFTGPTPAFPNRQKMVWTQCQDEDGHHLFPCIDHPSVKCSWSLSITVSDELTVVSNGELTGTQATDNGKTCWQWEQRKPIPAYLVTVVAGELEVLEASHSSVPTRYLAPKGTDRATMERVFGKTPEMIRWMSERLGVAYPWPRYDQVVVHDFIFGGMENAGATTLTDLSLTDERAALDWDAEPLILHELAHQWFGDLVTCSDWSQAWLNEGWATYSEYLWNCHDLGQQEADYGLFSQLGNYLGEAGGRYSRPMVHFHYRTPIDLFDRHLYEKGALVLHTLRANLGDDAFFEGTRSYLETHSEGVVHTRDFQQSMEQASGRNLDLFFQQYVHGAGHPQVNVKIAHSDGMLTLKITQKQNGDQVAKSFHFPLRVRWTQGGQSQLITLPVNSRSRAWALPCAEPPDRVEVDADFQVLCDLSVEASIEMLDASLKGDASVVGQIRAARGLAKNGTVPAIQALCNALTTAEFWGVRATIAGLLAKQGGDRARLSLLEARNDAHPKARRAIVAALGHFRHPDIHEALGQIVMQGDPSIAVEGEAGRALGMSRSPQLIDYGQQLLQRDTWGALIQIRALEGLGKGRDPAALPVLMEWTSEDKHPRAQAAAAAALGNLANAVPSVREAALPRLIEVAKGGTFRVRLAAIGALGQAQLTGSVGVLQHIHNSDPDGRVRRMSFEALAKIRMGRTSEDALASIRDELEKLRAKNQELVGRIQTLEDQTKGTKES